MRRTKTAVASDQGFFGRENLLRKVDVWTFPGKCAKTFAPMFGVVLCDQYYPFLHPDLLLKKYLRAVFSIEGVCWAIDCGTPIMIQRLLLQFSECLYTPM